MTEFRVWSQTSLLKSVNETGSDQQWVTFKKSLGLNNVAKSVISMIHDAFNQLASFVIDHRFFSVEKLALLANHVTWCDEFLRDILLLLVRLKNMKYHLLTNIIKEVFFSQFKAKSGWNFSFKFQFSVRIALTLNQPSKYYFWLTREHSKLSRCWFSYRMMQDNFSHHHRSHK